MTTIDDIDLEDLALWAGPRQRREELFTLLRAESPRRYFRERDLNGQPRRTGYWALSTYEDIVTVSRRPEDFSSGRGVNIADFPPALTEWLGSIIAMDDPRHARIRRIVARGFTPRMLDNLRSDVERIAADLIGSVGEQGECDFVTEIAAPLPLRILLDLMGIPRSEEKFILDATNVILGSTDPEYVPDQSGAGLRNALMSAATDLTSLLRELAQSRTDDPRNDLITVLVTAEAEEEILTPQELASFFILLVGAGNETTRNAISHGLLALTEHPEQRQRWHDNFDDLASTAVEELVRWASPVLHMRRTVTRDGVHLGEQEFAEGDKVVLWYYSANRDEKVFEEPFRFDLGRRPNDHLGFGAPGPHFCLGAHLARREITVAFRELFAQLPDIHTTGEPDFLRANFIHGIKHLPAAFTPARRSS